MLEYCRLPRGLKELRRGVWHIDLYAVRSSCYLMIDHRMMASGLVVTAIEDGPGRQ
jgi:hypothetical protein